jgi:ABC-type transporter Mla MlaB component
MNEAWCCDSPEARTVSEARTDSAGGAVTIRIDDTADIATASELKARLKAALEEGRPLVADLSRAGRADTAVLQLLIAFSREAHVRGLGLEWKAPSADFLASARLTGVVQELGLAAFSDGAANSG